MSQNVEITKRVIDAMNRRDLNAYDEFFPPDFEWFPAMPGTIEGGSYRGREGVETYGEEVRDTWDEVRVVGEEFRDLGDRVLMLGRIEGRGRGSGVPVDAPMGMIFDFCDDKITRLRDYLDHDEALRAGLAE
jgi:ketosteroid isomerase-like protein